MILSPGKEDDLDKKTMQGFEEQVKETSYRKDDDMTMIL